MHIRILLPAAAFAALSFASLAQTVQAPTAVSADPWLAPLPSMPPYGQHTALNQIAPTATATGGPLVAPPPTSPQAYVSTSVPYEDRVKSHDGSVYIPMDSWVYPAMTRLYSLGFADKMYVAMRPYTRQRLAHILEATHDDVLNSDSEEAKEILAVVEDFVREEPMDGVTPRGTVYGTETYYTRLLGIQGQSLNDSYHLGQTIVNDYGRPYQPGFNAIAGFSTLAESGRFSFYFRGEYQHAPSAVGYSQTLSAALSQGANLAGRQYTAGDEIPFSGYNLHQRTIPTGPIPAANPFRIMEATLSFHWWGHEISGGKTDEWQGPLQGGAMSWSNNAQDIYSFRIDRIEPLYIPGFSWLFGTVRYNFMYGDLKGHSYPNSPYVHSEQLEIRPTDNSEIGIARTVIFGGEGHVPVTIHTFLRSFFSLQDTENNPASKNSPLDPGARFTDFSFSWRLPYVRKYVTLLADTFVHDDYASLSAPRRSAYRTGLYFPQIPGARKFDFRIEAVNTDPKVSRSTQGQFFYFESIERQGYTNEGNIFGDWIGREGKGGQAVLTYHMSGNEFVQVEYLNKKNDHDFIPGAYNPATNTYGPGGTTQNDLRIEVAKRFHHDDIELNAWYQHEGWKAPIYLPGQQDDNAAAVQVTFFPALKTR